MTRRRKLLILIAAAPVLLVVIAILYLNFVDLSGWKDTVERLVSNAIGRELRINGDFQPEIGFTTRVVATAVTLANADWSDDPQMVSVDRLAGEIDLLSILFGPITIDDVEISGARVVFETNADGAFNWALGDGEPSGGSDGEFEMVIGHALITDFELLYAGPRSEPLKAALDKLEFTDDGSGMLDLDLIGDIDGSSAEISGRLGTFTGLINATRVKHDLEGRFADADFALRGSIEDVSSLSGVEGDVSFTGPRFSRVTAAFGLVPVLDGPFSADVAVKDTPAGSAFNLRASLGEMHATADGTVDSIGSPEAIDVSVNASGPDVSAIGELAGVDDLPAKPFSISGRVQWAGFPLTCDKVEVRVGDNTLSAHGVLGKPPLLEGTDFEFSGGGPDISALAALAGLEVPKEQYTLDGHLIRIEHGIDVRMVKLSVGGISLQVDGKVGDPPGYEGTSLSFQGKGSNLARLDHLVGVTLPAEPFSVSGRLAQGQGAIELDGVGATVGDTSLQVSGQLTTEAGLGGSDLRVMVAGPDASQLALMAELDAVPAEPFSVDGRVRVLGNGYRIHELAGSLGSLNLRADGVIAASPNLVGSDLQIHVEDSDLAHPVSIFGVTDLPHDPVSIDARVRVEASGYRVSNLQATIGDVGAEIDGFVGLPPELGGTEIRIEARGARLADLGPYLKEADLPDASFSVSGGFQLDERKIGLDRVVALIGGHRVEVHGTVAPAGNLAGTGLALDFSGPALREVGRMVGSLVELPELPQEPYALIGRLTIDDAGYEFQEVGFSLAEARVTAAGRVGFPPDFMGSDFTVTANGPNASLLSALTGVSVPVAPFELSGRVERSATGLRFHQVAARLGEYRIAIDGILGKLPKLIGTELEIHASGPDTNLIEELGGLPDLRDQPFTLDGEFSGTPEHLSTRDFKLTFGSSDLEGSFEVDITGKPTVTARLDAHILDLSQLRERLETVEDAAHETAKTQTTKKQKGALLFPDEPMSLEWLQAADADVAIRIDHLYLRANQLRDLTVDVHLEDGRLAIDRMTAAGRGEGRMSGSLLFEPHQDVHRLDADISVRQIRLDPPEAMTQLVERPPIDIDIDLEAVGGTPHQLASSTNGAVQLVIGKGIFESSTLDLVTADILLTLIKAFNPFAKEDPTTELECGIALLSFEDGVAKLEPMAFQSDKMTMLGKGKIDLGTEKLNLEWVTKPRKGIGISASMITNPYIKLGGTLASPSIELKPLEAVTSTGVAVATMGLSLVAKGMFDRVTAEKKVCKKALEEIGRRADDSAKK